MPREALYLLKRIIRETTVCGIEVVEVSPPYDVSDMTALMATRVICDTMAHLVVSEQLPRRQKPSYIHEEANMGVDQVWE
jgi:agmatinase